MNNSDKIAIVFAAFTPWWLIWLLSFAFTGIPGLDTFELSLALVSRLWTLVSPFITLFIIWLALGAYKLEEKE